MRKLILVVAILAGGFLSTANNVLPTAITSVYVAVDFEEIPVEKLPEAVTTSVKTNHASATIVKAFVNAEEVYKLELQVEEEVSTVYVDKTGEFIEGME